MEILPISPPALIMLMNTMGLMGIGVDFSPPKVEYKGSWNRQNILSSKKISHVH